MPRTLAERLGFSADARVAVIHADDIGMCHASNVGAFETLDAGPATCGSVMVPCPGFPEAAAMARDRGNDVDLGVHLTLNAEWADYRWAPVLGAARVPSLVDDDGYLHRTTAQTLEHALEEEVELELRAQIDRALDAGIDVTHLDSHMGTALLPPFTGVYARLAGDYRLPAFAVRPDAAALAGRAEVSASLQMILEALDRMEAAGVPLLDGFDDDSLGFGPGEGRDHNLARLRRLGPGVHYLICHPARAGEELSAIAADADCRDFERRFYGGAEGRAALAEAGIATVGMRALRELMRRPGSSASTPPTRAR